MLNEKLLAALLTLAETGNFQEAAKRMGVSNASLSRYIAQAEDQVGFPVFHRKRGNSGLTRQGQAFLPIAKKLQSDLLNCERRIKRIRSETTQTVRIGCGPLTPRTLIKPIVEDALRVLPDFRVTVSVNAHHAPMDMLEHDEIDLYVGDLTHTPETENIEIMMFKKRAVAFAAHVDHPLQGKPDLTLHDVFSYPFASPHLHKHWRMALTKALGADEAAARKVASLPQVESDDYAFLTALLGDPNLIVGGMPETFAEHLTDGTVKLMYPTPEITWNICAARKTGSTTPALDFLWQSLSAQSANFSVNSV